MYLPLVVLMYLLIFITEGLPILKKKQKRITALYFSLLFISFILMSMLVLGLKISGPSETIKKVVFLILGKKDGG